MGVCLSRAVALLHSDVAKKDSCLHWVPDQAAVSPAATLA